MRLEKIVYERIFNTKLLGRAREFTRPTMSQPETDMLLTVGPKFGLDLLLRPIGKFIWSREWKCMMEGLKQRGLAPEDIQVFRAEEIRRDPLWEHAVRESMNPMMREIPRYRKMRYFKVDFGVKGFEAPDYIKEEARKRTYFQSLSNLATFRHFFKQNYQNDQTPNSVYIRTSLVILELALYYGVTSRNAWNRYFWNEVHYYTIAKFMEEGMGPNDGPDLASEEGWNDFIAHAKEMNSAFPGKYAPEGEEVDAVQLRKEFLELQAQTGWKRITDQDLTNMGLRNKMGEEPFIQPKFEGEEAKGKSNVGLDMPTFLRKWTAKGFFN